ncbi:MAG: response regulator transcription factor [Pseudomonadota bacterium]
MSQLIVPRPAPSPIRVALVEDDAGFRDALTEAVCGAADMLLCGSAASQAEGLALLQGMPADVLLVDLGLPDGSGIVVIAAAAQQWPLCSIMVSSSFGDDSHVMRSLEAGAVGYLLKNSSAPRMLDEIRSLASGGSPISPIIARQVLARLRPHAGAQEPAAGASPLSLREQEVLTFISKGFTAPEIAGLLAVSQFTVRSFVRRIYDKLKVRSKAEAIYEARSLGWLPD